MELRRISYVEDEADIRTIVKMALVDIGGFELDICDNGFQALTRIPLFLPQIILLDMMMPGMDGIQTLKRLKALSETADIPVVFITAKIQRHEIENYKMLGAFDVIPKPFDPVGLPRMIRTIWSNIARNAA